MTIFLKKNNETCSLWVFFQVYCQIPPCGHFKVWKPLKKFSPKLLNADVKSKIETFVQQNYINARKKIYITVKLKKKYYIRMRLV